MMLEAENFEVIATNNGEEALNIIINEVKGEFDVIVTDYQMPKINGQEFAETLKLYNEYNHLPIVLVTQATHITYENNEKYRIFDKILHKPVTNNFVTEIKNILLEKEKNKNK